MTDHQSVVSDILKPDQQSKANRDLSFRLSLTAMVAFGFVDIARFFLTSRALSHLDADNLEMLQVSTLLFPFLICAALIVARGNYRNFLGPSSKNVWANAVIGLVVGLLASFAIFPVAFGKADLLLERMIALSAYQMRPRGLLELALLILGLPVVGEWVFRGIALEELRKHFSFPAAAAITCGMYAVFWPALNPLSRVVFAALSVTSYRKTGSLLASVVGNAILAAASCFAALWHLLR
jgi:membrane protease YdiL (CAAX protease family)